MDNNSVESIQIPDAIDGDTIYAIGESAFQYCYNLKPVKLPPSISTIDVDAFAYCTSLKEIDLIGTQIDTIYSRAFEGCAYLQSVSLSPALRRVGYYAFRDCKNLTEVVIPPGLTEVGFGSFFSGSGTSSPDAFQGCTALPQEVLDALKAIGYK